MEQAKVLVTGGAGFIGSHLVDALVERGHRVRVLDALVSQVHGENAAPAYLNSAAEFIQADVCDRNAVNGALEDIDVVFHEAAEVGVGQSMYEIERYVRANDLGTAVLLEAILGRRPQIKKLVVASSMSIYGEGAYTCESCGSVAPQLRPVEQLLSRDWEIKCPKCGKELSPALTSEEKPLFPTSVYAVTKQDQEQFCLAVGRSYGIPAVALRYFNVYGTRQALSNPYTGVLANFASRYLNGRAPIIFEDGEQKRDFVHVRDLAQACVLALENPAVADIALNIGSGNAYSILEVAQRLARVLDCTHLEPEISGRYRAGDIRNCFADISRARRLLGYQPGIELEAGLAELSEWLAHAESTDHGDRMVDELQARGLVA